MRTFTVQQVAEIIQVSEDTVYKMIRDLPLEEGNHYFKVGRLMRIKEDGLKKLMGE